MIVSGKELGPRLDDILLEGLGFDRVGNIFYSHHFKRNIAIIFP